MWQRLVALLVVVLAALYNIILYSNILQKIIYPYTKGYKQTTNPIVLKSSHETQAAHTNNTNIASAPKFYIIPTPEITTDLLQEHNTASTYYESQLNEESAEVWLHRGFEHMLHGRTINASEADVFLLAGYFHLARMNNKARTYVTETILSRIHDKSMPHVVLCPTWNPTTSRQSGIAHFISQLQQEGLTNLYSVGFERNPAWQVLNTSNIIPIPYVVRPSFPREELIQKAATTERREDFVFYAGDARKHAVEWAGCNRTHLISPLYNASNMDVSIKTRATRLVQQEYNNRMFTSDYCLILCGDTVTSRSLTSSIVYGCIPVRVGSRLRGLCDAPCHVGWGWTVTGERYPHLPFPTKMDWNDYPEVNEAQFGEATLQAMFQNYTPERKKKMRQNMLQHQLGWIYGWGDPVSSDDFGQASEYVWQSIIATLGFDKTLAS